MMADFEKMVVKARKMYTRQIDFGCSFTVSILHIFSLFFMSDIVLF